MGSGAFIPRLALGAYKGATEGGSIVRGIASAAKSGALEKAVSVGRFTPFLKNSEAFSNLGKKSLAATEDWEKLSGTTAADIVSRPRGIGVGDYRVSLGDVMNNVLNATPAGRTFLKNFAYDPTEWVRLAGIKDIVQRSAIGMGISRTDMRAAINAKVKNQSIEPFMKEIKPQVEEALTSTPIAKAPPFEINVDSAGAGLPDKKETDLAMAKLASDGTGLDQKMIAAAPGVVSGVDDAASIMKNPTPYISGDPVENTLRILNEKMGGGVTLEDLAAVVNSGSLDATGAKWFDNMMNSISDFKIKIGKNEDNVIRVGKADMDN